MSASEVQLRLRAVIDATQTTYREWVDGGLTEISQEDDLWKKFTELAATGRDAAGIAGKYFEAAADFFRRWAAFVRSARSAATDEIIIPVPVWEAWEKLEDYRTLELRRQAPTLETLAELEKLPNIGAAQIARIYGWEDEIGRPDLNRVREEQAKDPKDRVIPTNPNQARFDRDHAERMEKVASYRNRARRKVEAYTKPGRESLQELIADGVSAEQISKIKRISTQEVFRLCEEQGLPAPPLDYSASSAKNASKTKPVSEVKEAAAERPAAKPKRGRPKKEEPAPEIPEIPADDDDLANILAPGESLETSSQETSDDMHERNIDEQIASYHAAGYQPAELVQVMSESGYEVDLSRVKRVIKEVKSGTFAMSAADSDEE